MVKCDFSAAAHVIDSGVVASNRADTGAATSIAVRFVFLARRFFCSRGVMHWNNHIDASVMKIQRVRVQYVYLDDSRATISTGTLSYSAENPTLAQHVFNLGTWLLPETCH